MLQHVSDHKGSIIRELYTLLGYNYSNGSIVSVDMDVVGVMAACTVHVNGHDRTITVILAKNCIKFPDYGSLVIRNMLEQF